ncbi:hypothetical protein [Sporichthya sp.]|uniref:hypothetical protein n=1 Tax=Sporichthya sp. TaxID=65475 RepID=UPI0017953F2A|nr:hypothetical protein [Sporichthya sp.]MBA3744528.1 hypothetical protein [Sporichthya sp.]
MSDEYSSEGELGGTSEEDLELRAMLSALDPMSARVPVESPTSPRARHQLEQIMSQGTEITETVTPIRSRKGKTWLAAAAAVAAIAIGTTVAVGTSGGDSNKNVVAQDPKQVLALKGSGADPMMSMCIMFDVNQLRTAAVAFGGTVTSVDSEKVTLDVDRWFKGTPKADAVTIAIPPGGDNVALDGVAFVQGDRYLISATDGVLGTCGYSGPASADFEKSFETAFPGA